MSTFSKESRSSAQLALLSYVSPILNALSPDVTDFVINSNGTSYIYYSDGRVVDTANNLISREGISALALLMAGFTTRSVTNDNPSVSFLVKEPRRARFEIVLPPACEEPQMSVRLYTFSNATLDGLREVGMMSLKQEEDIKGYVRGKKNIIISGETGSGKTTLLNAMINYISSYNMKERIICIEDIEEISSNLPNFQRLVTNPVQGGYDGSAAVVNTLRQRPDRIIYGEVRTSAAFDLLDSWYTGHGGGMGTIHSQSARGAIERLAKLASRKESTISFEVCHDIVTTAVDVVIQIAKDGRGRRYISEIEEIEKERK